VQLCSLCTWSRNVVFPEPLEPTTTVSVIASKLFPDAGVENGLVLLDRGLMLLDRAPRPYRGSVG
jgi:hypothetical protein